MYDFYIERWRTWCRTKGTKPNQI